MHGVEFNQSCFHIFYSQLLQSSTNFYFFHLTFFIYILLLNHGNKSVEIKNNEQPTYRMVERKKRFK